MFSSPEPQPTPPPPNPSSTANASVNKAAAGAKAGQTGMASTMMTGGMGLQTPATTGQKQLTGQ